MTKSRVLAVLFTLAILAELFARFGLGLGDPPLSVADDESEYRFVPGEYLRFGNRVAYNEWSQRSEPIARTKANPREFRVLAIGDSVLNGGATTDQSGIATELIKPRLQKLLGRPVATMNASAGSWGPANMLGYVRKYGTFDADAVAVVISSHDAYDVPTWKPVVGVNENFPGESPVLALSEAIARYLPRYVPMMRSRASGDPMGAGEPSEADYSAGLGALEELLQTLKNTGARVVVVQHLERDELDAPKPGHARIAAVAERLGIQVVQLAPAVRRSIAEGRNPYRDNIHLNDEGQRALADVLAAAVKPPE